MNYLELAVLRALWTEQVSPEPNSGCWLWIGSADWRGYGRLGFRGRVYWSHQLALELHGSPKPFHKAMARHRCDTPACVNPDHLEWGTHTENMRDAIARGRFSWAQLERGQAINRTKSCELFCDHCGVGFRRARSKLKYPRRYCDRACADAGLASATHCVSGHEYTPANTYLRPDTQRRQCRTCIREASTRHRARKRDDETREMLTGHGLEAA